MRGKIEPGQENRDIKVKIKAKERDRAGRAKNKEEVALIGKIGKVKMEIRIE